eukprot:1395370-Amorphochlora_amoeboformis.AAC.1
MEVGRGFCVENYVRKILEAGPLGARCRLPQQVGDPFRPEGGYRINLAGAPWRLRRNTGVSKETRIK